MTYDFSVGIVNWNTAELVCSAIQSIYDLAGSYQIQVLVADNNSSDDSVHQIRTRFPQVHLEANQENIGFARAHNQLWQHSKAPIHILLNSDVRLLNGQFESVNHCFQVHPEVGIYGPQMLDGEGVVQISCRRFPSLWRQFCMASGVAKILAKNTHFNGTVMGDFDHRTSRPVDQVIGSFFAVRQSVWQSIGFLDELFFMYYEEVDYCLRARKAGFLTYFDANQSVIHYGGASSKQVKVATMRRTVRSMRTFFRKHSGPLTWWILLFCLSLETVTRTVYALSHKGQTAATLRACCLAWLDFVCFRPSNQRIT
ncbi:MAG: glycosyltransferase family 2 protein [Acidobacteria bacterium]|nr:glycosyltransferase family 2 protein [Acidobacteriota bacterium]MCB9396419.1 glycosyltransferase family 2 protein [Acidobacteriota bacterium]